MRTEIIRNFLSSVMDDPLFFRSSYNKSKFIPGKSTIYYSGQYWDENELAAAIESFLFGKRIKNCSRPI